MALRMSTGLRNKLNGIKRNLLIDGDFEVGTLATNWTNTLGSTINASSPITGTYDCKMTADGSAAELRYTAAIAVQAGQMYGVRCQAKYAVGAQSLVMQVGTTAGTANISTETKVLTVNTAEYDMFFRVPDGTSSVYLSFKTSEATSTYLIEIDDIIFYPAGGCIREIFRKGFLKIYSGTQPTSADDVINGVLLCTIYSDGTTTGLTFQDSATGTMPKTSTETWSGTAVATGTAGWFRFVAVGDTGASSTIEPRIDGTVATSGAQINMSSTSVTTSAVQTISTFQVTVPAE